MPSQTGCKVKALMIFAMLAIAEGHRVQQQQDMGGTQPSLLEESQSSGQENSNKSPARKHLLMAALMALLGQGSALQVGVVPGRNHVGTASQRVINLGPTMSLTEKTINADDGSSATTYVADDGSQIMTEFGTDGSQTVTSIAADGSRRALFGKAAAAALAGLAAADSASAKFGQFSKQELFGTGISSPYQAEGAVSGPNATYGYARSGDGSVLAKGYEKDVEREKALFLESASRLAKLQENIDSRTWYAVRNELRNQAYDMRSSMQALNSVKKAQDKVAADKAYKEFWTQVESLDRVVKDFGEPRWKKSSAGPRFGFDPADSRTGVADINTQEIQLSRAQQEYDAVLAALERFKSLI